MRFSFLFPAVLWLLALLIPLWALALAVPRRLSSARFWGSLLLRTALMAALVLALAGARLVSRVDDLTTVFLIDSSDSVSPSARGQAEAFVQEALKAMRPNDHAAVVVFGENALVERAPSAERTLGRLTSAPVAARTNIQDAIQLGLALLPADTDKRLVLLSDGGENSGHALEATRIATARGVPIDYVDLSAPSSGSEALIAGLDAPTNVRQGQTFDLVATVESNVAQSALLRIFGDEQVLLEQNVQLQPGQNRFSLKVDAKGQGFQRYRARIEPQNDVRAQNNQADTIVRVGGVAKVLLVEGQPGEGRNLKDALAAAHVAAETVAPDAMPADLTGLGNYEAVVLINVPVRALPIKLVANLPAYVRELGKGLIMIGGDRSYGVGGYSHTPIEEALPVYMDVRDRQERPDLALIFIIDKSGSMNACHCSGPNRQTAQPLQGGTPKIDIAKDAVVQASAVLGKRDTVGVVAFDDGAHWALPAQRGPSPDTVQNAVAPLLPDGQTNVRAGLQAAEDALNNTNAKIKHAILLTDGWSRGGDNLDITQRMRDEGITVSVVAAGGGSADYLKRIAETGGGRFYPAQDMADVPQIFVQETITAVGNYLIEEPFTPKYAASSPILEGLDKGLPQLYGYNGTTAKETASTILVGVDDAPVLAQWQYGLGRAIAWTSDAKGKWAKDWVRWPEFPRFAAQLVQWVVPSATNSKLTTVIRSEGAQTVIDVKAQDDSGKPQDGLQVQAGLVGANNFSQQARLTQVAPGEYRASIASPIQGTYLVQLAGSRDGRVVAQETAGMVVPYSPEYRLGQSNPALLDALAQASGGVRLQRPAEAFVHAPTNVVRAQEIALPLLLLVLLLLPFDIGVRRLMLRRGDFTAAFVWLRGKNRRSPAPAPHLAKLRQAKARAAHRSDSGGQPVMQQSAQQLSAAERKDTQPASADSTTAEDSMERLRAARDRARRRARGEEE
jgi:Ca-activated chloride channel family protein